MRRSRASRVLAVTAVVMAVIAAVAGSRAPRRDTGVLLIRVSDGARERLTAMEGATSWSRDGRRVFVSGDTVDSLSYVFAVFAGGRRVSERAVRSPAVLGGEVAVSPGEQRIAFVRAPRGSRLVTGDLTVAQLGSGVSHRLLGRSVGTPAWSPDGKRIAVERYSRREATGVVGKRDDASRVAIVRSDGSGPVRSAGRGEAPTWLPDGRLLLLVDTRRSRAWSSRDLTAPGARRSCAMCAAANGSSRRTAAMSP
jgi:Tol biopolymer transport system component